MSDPIITDLQKFLKIYNNNEDVEIHKPIVDYGISSLDEQEIILAIEEEYGISISDEESSLVGSLNDLAELVRTKIA